MVYFRFRCRPFSGITPQFSSLLIIKNDFLRFFIVFLLLFLLPPGPGIAQDMQQPANHEANRAKLLSYLIRKDLETRHFTHKKIDDKMSEAAFGLYLKQLDYQKRILLREDVVNLRKYVKLMDDEMNSGNLALPVRASATLSARAAIVHGMVREILSEDFDFSAKEVIETDAEKIEYCKDDLELRERWRKILKYEILHQYLGQTEEHTSVAGETPKLKERPAAGRPTVGAQATEPQEDKQPSEDKDLRKAARDKVMKNYDQFFLRISREKEAEHYERFFNAVARTFDPHTDYMPPTNKEDFDISMRGSLEGIGATLKEDEGHIKVVTVVAGSPAARQGQLQAEDLILKVGEGASEPITISGMRVQDAVKLIRGKKGTEVRLTIKKPDEKILTVAIVRDIIQIEDTFVKSAVIRDEEKGDTFGYLKIPSFYRDFEGTSNGSKGRNVTDDVRAALTDVKAQNIRGLILDLRNNGGGALTDAVKIAGLFIETGPVVQVKSGNDAITTLSDDLPEIMYDGPAVILVNTISASASEILAGALQNYGRAVIMGGEHTHGKGTVQTILDLDSNIPKNIETAYKPLGALKLTIQKFYRINGDSTQYRGVVPDIVLPDVLGGLRTGEQYLDFALPWDTVKPLSYAAWQKCRPDLSVLRQKSLTRVSSSQQFIDMEKESARLAEKRKNTLRSLNIEDVRKEIEESRIQKEKDLKSHASQKKPAGEAKTPEGKREDFLKAVSDDNYVKEAMTVIKDMMAADPSCLSAQTN
ncbi:MAG: carboxy terminal-processing peptidase [Nitrospirae bacterium]|nr:carboxy terminal-processing peptidase [Nitrospirota bacterium]